MEEHNDVWIADCTISVNRFLTCSHSQSILQQANTSSMWEGQNFVFDSRQHLGIKDGTYLGDAGDEDDVKQL